MEPLTIHFWDNLASILTIFAFSFTTTSWLNEKRDKGTARKLEIIAAGILLAALAITTLVVRDYSFWTVVEAGICLIILVGLNNMKSFVRWLKKTLFSLTEMNTD
ncbi:TPA: hypothetical protein DEX28_00065 [Patescibacteria group bacterium]|nr:MAG: hypothetical protein UW85_C0003G0041 [Parcubacteria group bacterium GW2011_GWA1_Parcubacteria_45_10]KKT88832.1 MAG: hypothetical protein UW89_C0004G0031 [Parcubacteria group bacterium GW2011_GWB1_45_10]HCI05134.1 hypothetical protein [Patescibacteria group bacterium]